MLFYLSIGNGEENGAIKKFALYGSSMCPQGDNLALFLN